MSRARRTGTAAAKTGNALAERFGTRQLFLGDLSGAQIGRPRFLGTERQLAARCRCNGWIWLRRRHRGDPHGTSRGPRAGHAKLAGVESQSRWLVSA